MKIRKTTTFVWDWKRDGWIDPNNMNWGDDELKVLAKVYDTLPPVGLVSLDQPYSVEAVTGSRVDSPRTLTVRIRY